MDFELEYLVIRLHDIPREVEQRVGFGELSKRHSQVCRPIKRSQQG